MYTLCANVFLVLHVSQEIWPYDGILPYVTNLREQAEPMEGNSIFALVYSTTVVNLRGNEWSALHFPVPL